MHGGGGGGDAVTDNNTHHTYISKGLEPDVDYDAPRTTWDLSLRSVQLTRSTAFHQKVSQQYIASIARKRKNK